VINQIRGFLIERCITMRQGVAPLRKALPDILSSNTDVLSPRMVSLFADLAQDWRRLDGASRWCRRRSRRYRDNTVASFPSRWVLFFPFVA